MESIERSQITKVHYYIVILTNHSRPECLWGNVSNQGIVYSVSIKINVLNGSILANPQRI